METVQTITLEEEKVINDLASDLFQRLEISGAFDLLIHEQAVDVVLDTPDSGIVIGYHGEVLDSLQLILSLIIAKKIGRFVRVTLEVGDYKKNRSAYLEKLAEQIKEKVVSEQREYTLPALKSWERRVVHLRLQDDDQVTSESIGEGKDRILIVKPKA